MHTRAVAAVGFMVAACALERSMAARGLRMYEAADTALQEAGMASLGVVTDIDRYKAVLWRARQWLVECTAGHIGARPMV